MALIPTVALVLAILFISTFIRSALGFGDALLAMPLLALVIDLPTATPLVGFVAATVSLLVLFTGWRSVDLRATGKLVVATLAGIPLGLLFLKAAPEAAVKGVLGVMLIGFGLYNLLAPRLPVLRGDGLTYGLGLIAGVLGGAYNTNGPPVVVYGALQRWPPDKFRATLQAYFLPTGLSILIGQGLAGLWTPTVLRLYAYSLPVTLLAIVLGGWASRHLPAGRFNQVVHAFLILAGGLMFL